MTQSRDETALASAFLKALAPGGSVERLSPRIGPALAARPLPRGVDLAALLRRLEADTPLTPAEAEALVADLVPACRPARSIAAGRPLPDDAVPDESARRWLDRARSATGLLHLSGSAVAGTCVLVGPDLVMTTRHQATELCTGLGIRRIGLQPQVDARVQFAATEALPACTVAVRRAVLVHPYWDVALLAVEPTGRAPIPLACAPRGSGRDVALIGYPAFAPSHSYVAQFAAFGAATPAMHVSSGRLTGRAGICSHERIVPALAHDALPLGGWAGSALVDLQDGGLVGLQFATHAFERSYAVPASALARDARIVAAGVCLDGPAPGSDTELEQAWRCVEPVGAEPAHPLEGAEAAHLPPGLRGVLGGGGEDGTLCRDVRPADDFLD